MFKYEFPCGGFYTVTKVGAEDGHMTFDPPVFEQRYCAAIQILQDERWAQEFKKIAEFGCADMKFLPLLKRTPNTEHILQIDIDEYLLKINQTRADPLISDYLKKRDTPLHIDLLEGNVAHTDETLQNVDVVIGLELIEHVFDDVLKVIPKNIFGIIKPKLVILSTPNADFNVLFVKLKENGMRHLDHKFEWTRAEFEAWCLQITKDYANYKVAFKGVGAPPPGKEALGYVSQIAIFARNDLLDLPLLPIANAELPAAVDEANRYKLVHTSNYPMHVDNRTQRERIRDDINYYIFNCMLLPKYLCHEDYIYKVALTEIVQHTAPNGGTEAIVRELLVGMPDYLVEGDTVLIKSGEDSDLGEDDISSDSYARENNDDGDAITEDQLSWD